MVGDYRVGTFPGPPTPGNFWNCFLKEKKFFLGGGPPPTSPGCFGQICETPNRKKNYLLVHESLVYVGAQLLILDRADQKLR